LQIFKIHTDPKMHQLDINLNQQDNLRQIYKMKFRFKATTHIIRQSAIEQAKNKNCTFAIEKCGDV